MASIPSLLLLPGPPQPATRLSIETAYRTPFTAVIEKLRPQIDSCPDGQSTVLVIAVACPILKGSAGRSKTLAWGKAQSYLAALYSLISTICAEQSIASDLGGGPGSLDARIVLVDHEPEREYFPDPFSNKHEANSTTVLDLAAFASTVHPWLHIYHPSCEGGYGLLNSYLKHAEGHQALLQDQLVVVDGGLSISIQGVADDIESKPTVGYPTTCLGGTFDHLHPGHKLLLHGTSLLLKVPEGVSDAHCEMIVGISSDELLVKKKFAEELEPWEKRAQGVVSFLSTVLNAPTTAPVPTTESEDKENMYVRFRDGRILVRCMKLRDPFGPPVSEEAVDAIVISGETRSGGVAINDKRSANNWHPLDIFEIDILDAQGTADEVGGGTATRQDFEAKISSTEIRRRRAEARAAKSQS